MTAKTTLCPSAQQALAQIHQTFLAITSKLQRLCYTAENSVDARVQTAVVIAFGCLTTTSLVIGSSILFSASLGAFTMAIYLIAREKFPHLSTAINYALLEPYYLTAESMKEHEKNIADGKFDGFKTLSNHLSDNKEFAKVLYKANALPWFLTQVEKVIMKNGLPDELCDKLHQQLQLTTKIFDQNEATLPLISKSGRPLAVNKYALLLASPYYRTRINYADVKMQPLHCKETSFIALRAIDQFLCHGSIKAMDFDTAMEVLKFAQFYQIKQLAPSVLRWTQNFIQAKILAAKKEAELEKILKDLAVNSDLLEDQWCGNAQCEAIANLYQLKYKSPVPFLLERDCYSIPLDALYLTQRSEEKVHGDYFKRVNCISIPAHCDPASLLKLKMFPGGLNQFHSVAFERLMTKTELESVVKLFPKLKTIYIYIGDKLIISNNNFEIPEEIPTKFVVKTNLLNDTQGYILIKADGYYVQFEKLVALFSKVTFANLAATLTLDCNNCRNVNGFDLAGMLNTAHKDTGIKFKTTDQHFYRNSFSIDIDLDE